MATYKFLTVDLNTPDYPITLSETYDADSLYAATYELEQRCVNRYTSVIFDEESFDDGTGDNLTFSCITELNMYKGIAEVLLALNTQNVWYNKVDDYYNWSLQEKTEWVMFIDSIKVRS